MPQAMSTLLPLLESEDATDDDIARVISLEPSLLFQTLRLVPPGPEGIMQVKTHLMRAVRELGRAGLYLMVSGILFRQCGVHFNPALPAAYLKYWRHAIAGALIARELATSLGVQDPEVEYTAALLHGIGKVPPLTAVDGTAPSGYGKDGIGDHLLSAGYPLPPALDAVRYLHHPPEDIKTALPSLRLMFAARRMADALAKGAQANFEAAIEMTGLLPDQLEQVFSTATVELERVHEALGITETQYEASTAPGSDSLTGHMAKAMVDSAVRRLLDAAESQDAVFDALRLTLITLFGVENWLVALPGLHAGTMSAVQCCVQGHASRVSIEIPADRGGNLIASAFAEQREKSYGTVNSGPRLMLADRQILDMLGDTAMHCLPWAGMNDTGGVLVCGIPVAWPHRIDHPDSDLRTVLDAVLQRCHTTGTPPQPTIAKPAPKAPHQQLAVQKTVHEINNPLGIIKNYLSILRMKLPEEHEAQGELGIIGDEISRISGLLNNLVSSDRESTGDWFDINHLIEDIVTMIQNSLPEPDAIQFHTQLDDTLPQIFSSKDTIKQIVVNLLKNAMEAVDSGGNIFLTTGHGANAMFPTIRVGIRDDGTGIPEEVKQRLFQPYNSTKEGENEGLGLYITWQALRRLGGTISCESVEGKGTDFEFELPVHPDRLAPPGYQPDSISEDIPNR